MPPLVKALWNCFQILASTGYAYFGRTGSTATSWTAVSGRCGSGAQVQNWWSTQVVSSHCRDRATEDHRLCVVVAEEEVDWTWDRNHIDLYQRLVRGDWAIVSTPNSAFARAGNGRGSTIPGHNCRSQPVIKAKQPTRNKTQ